MVMHGQVADFMDILFGESSELGNAGEINFVVPLRQQRQFDQELEDLSAFIETDDLSLIPNMEHLLGKSSSYVSLPQQLSRGTVISYKIEFAPSEDADHPAHSRSLIKVFTGHSVGSQGFKVSSGGQRRLRSACADAQADLNLRWMHVQSCRKRCIPAQIIVSWEYCSIILSLEIR